MGSPSHPYDQICTGLPISDVRFASRQDKGSPAATSTGDTINHDGYNLTRINPSGGAVTGIILQAGLYHGQPLFLVNIASNAATFAAAGTSRVANGASAVVPALCMTILVWSQPDALWYGCESAP